MRAEHTPDILGRMRRRAALLFGLSAVVAAVFVACGEEEARTSVEPEEENAQPDEPSEPEETAEDLLAGTRVHLDLLALAHLADVEHHGPYLDFGTPARMHHTMGRWRNGFLSDAAAGERDFTRMGNEARAWF